MTCQPIPAPVGDGICTAGILCTSHSQAHRRTKAACCSGVHGSVAETDDSVSIETANPLAFRFASARRSVSMYCSISPFSEIQKWDSRLLLCEKYRYSEPLPAADTTVPAP